jgi:hypothetical protein
MDQPTMAIAESITGVMAAGPKAWMVMGGHIVQAMLKGKLFQQVSQEIKELREKGKILDDFADEKHKYGFKSWVELLTIIDEDMPDADRLDALKAMFYGVNKVNATHGQRIAAYQMFQIAKELTSGQLLYLNVCYRLYKSGNYGATSESSVQEWLDIVCRKMGHQVFGLADRHDFALAEYGLLHRRHPESHRIAQTWAPLTILGISFCTNIDSYHVETDDPKV